MTIMAQNITIIKTSARLLSKKPPEKEIIHSGHFMVSNFEAESQDDEDMFGTTGNPKATQSEPPSCEIVTTNTSSKSSPPLIVARTNKTAFQHIAIETSLTKLFQCMSLAYRQKLTSPKWNRFKGIRLRWKDKIRLNNVIWRCWHMQFITKKNALVCQFASPLDTDTHNKPEAIVLEGKYWKRKLNAVTAEYKKWRLFYRNRLLGWTSKDGLEDPQDVLSELEMLEWQPHYDDGNMLVDEDYMEYMTDTLFSTISANQPFAFPDTREIARGASLADFIQPSLVQLQPNLDDFMDTFEPLQELLYSKLPPVPEEGNSSTDDLYRSLSANGGFLSDVKSDVKMPSSYPLSSPPYRYPYSQPPFKNRAVPPPPPPYPIYPVPQYQQLSPPPPSSRASPSPPHHEFTPPGYPRVPIRSNSLPVAVSPSMRDDEHFVMPKLKTFNRSRSGSCLSSSPKTAPTLTSAVSEPQLTVTSPHSSVLLTHLLTSNSITPSCSSTGSSVHHRQGLKMSVSMSSLESSYFSERQPEKSSHRSVIYSTHSPEQKICERSEQLEQQRPKQKRSSHLRPQAEAGLGREASRDNGSLNLSANRDVTDGQIAPIYDTGFSLTTSVTGGRKLKANVPILLHPSAGLAPPPLHPSTPQVSSSASNSPQPESPGPSDALSLSPLNVDSPGSTPHSPTTTTTGGVYKEHRRVSHINAEQKRRCNIKNGFDTLHSLIPQLSQNPNAKLSKAAMLHKGAEYIMQLRGERQNLKEDMDSLRHQVEALNVAISNCQSMLPATGAPVSRQRNNKMREMFDEYVRVRTQDNWKFWILSLLCEPLLTSFSLQVSTASLDELYRTTLNWVDQHCTLTVLRPFVLNALRQLCTTTDILSDPSRLPAEARAATSMPSRPHPRPRHNS